MTERQKLEYKYILEALDSLYGYNFREYSKAHLFRRLIQRMELDGFGNLTQLLERLLYDEEYLQRLLKDFSINITEMFRDPEVFRYLSDHVFSYLATFPHLKIWHAGCSSGEEAFSLAILLKEAGLLDRTQIYATDFNEPILARAREGIVPISEIKAYSENYFNAGGRYSLSDYYSANYDAVIFSRELRDRIHFSSHNLVTDSHFGEMNLILCRNVLIYFSLDLQKKVVELFSKSLCHGGMLCLGTKETLDYSDMYKSFQVVSEEMKVYKKRFQ